MINVLGLSQPCRLWQHPRNPPPDEPWNFIPDIRQVKHDWRDRRAAEGNPITYEDEVGFKAFWELKAEEGKYKWPGQKYISRWYAESETWKHYNNAFNLDGYRVPEAPLPLTPFQIEHGTNRQWGGIQYASDMPPPPPPPQPFSPAPAPGVGYGFGAPVDSSRNIRLEQFRLERDARRVNADFEARRNALRADEDFERAQWEFEQHDPRYGNVPTQGFGMQAPAYQQRPQGFGAYEARGPGPYAQPQQPYQQEYQGFGAYEARGPGRYAQPQQPYQQEPQGYGANEAHFSGPQAQQPVPQRNQGYAAARAHSTGPQHMNLPVRPAQRGSFTDNWVAQQGLGDDLSVFDDGQSEAGSSRRGWGGGPGGGRAGRGGRVRGRGL
ncbi:hypothetical protein VTL71DRAFT_4954 [Oculimacula yallundae]|uniref:Uncharacterized protein n=1 Tax=Oculimacula yallundae TaxID=86028 RepID=A0ABR4C3H4_9HELO